MSDPARSAAALALFEKICDRLKSGDMEKAQEMTLVDPGELRAFVREEVKGAAAADEDLLADRLWGRLQERSTLEGFAGGGGDISDRVIRIVDRRIEQFLDRHLKSKELGDRISGIAKGEARLLFAMSVERLSQQIESRLAQEVEKAIDDLLRSDSLADRIRKVAREAVAKPQQQSAAAAS